jgi:hypothetical protein
MIDKKFIFLAGHHRSGTSLLHEIIREHPSISGLSDTGVPEDEGQHLQTVFEPANAFGGPGKYIFHPKSYMDENHALATSHSAEMIMQQWGKYFDQAGEHYIEKSPPNLIRTRFLQKLFPNSRFVVILRHPLAVSYATRKWSGTSIKSLLEHSLLGYEIFMKDMEYLRHVYVLRYEEFVANPQTEVDKIFGFLGLRSSPIKQVVNASANEKYLSMWESSRTRWINRILLPVDIHLETRANRFGYSISRCRELLGSSLLGAHHNPIPPAAQANA